MMEAEKRSGSGLEYIWLRRLAGSLVVSRNQHGKIRSYKYYIAETYQTFVV